MCHCICWYIHDDVRCHEAMHMSNMMVLCIQGKSIVHMCDCISPLSDHNTKPPDIEDTITTYYSEEEAEKAGWAIIFCRWRCPKCVREMNDEG